jgi:hypothetical protein
MAAQNGSDDKHAGSAYLVREGVTEKWVNLQRQLSPEVVSGAPRRCSSIAWV